MLSFYTIFSRNTVWNINKIHFRRPALPWYQNHTCTYYKKPTCQCFHEYRHKNPEEELGDQIQQYTNMIIHYEQVNWRNAILI